MVRNQSAIINTVRQFAEEVKKQGIHLRQVILFGSHARGDQQEWSDVDVALVADEFVGVSFEDIKWFIDITIQKPYFPFEFHTFNTVEFENGNPFVDEIKRTGIPVA